jgi:hypothetical protein
MPAFVHQFSIVSGGNVDLLVEDLVLKHASVNFSSMAFSFGSVALVGENLKTFSPSGSFARSFTYSKTVFATSGMTSFKLGVFGIFFALANRSCE